MRKVDPLEGKGIRIQAEMFCNQNLLKGDVDVPVITLTTTKGGAGKTTAALVLASILVSEGGSVVLIDADPNQPLAQWAGSAKLPDGLTVIGSVNEDNILETIEEQSAIKQFVIVDLEGSANLATSYAMSLSNLILIPIQASPLDASEAAKTLKLVDRQRRTLKGELRCMVFWQRANAAIETSSARDIRTQFEEAGIPLMKNRLVEREAFRAMFGFGTTLMQLQPAQVRTIAKAQENASAFVAEMLQHLRGK